MSKISDKTCADRLPIHENEEGAHHVKLHARIYELEKQNEALLKELNALKKATPKLS